MNIVFFRGFGAFLPGRVYSVPDGAASLHVRLGRAKLAADVAAPEKASPTVETEAKAEVDSVEANVEADAEVGVKADDAEDSTEAGVEADAEPKSTAVGGPRRRRRGRQ